MDYHVVSTSFRIVGEDVSEVGGTNGYDTGRTLRPLSTSRALPAHRMGSGRGHRRTGTLRLDTPAGSARPGARRSMLARAGRLRRSYRLSLRGWDSLRYEVTEEPSPGVDGGRWSHTPDLGIYHAVT